MDNKLKVSLEQTITLLGNSVQELTLYLRSQNLSDSVDSSTSILELIEVMAICEKDVREYLNKVGGRTGSKRVKALIDSLSDSLGNLDRLENDQASEVLRRTQRIIEEVCEPPDDC